MIENLIGLLLIFQLIKIIQVSSFQNQFQLESKLSLEQMPLVPCAKNSTTTMVSSNTTMVQLCFNGVYQCRKESALQNSVLGKQHTL